MANTSLINLRTKGRAEIKLDRIGRIWSDIEWNEAINEAIVEIQNKGDFKWSENQSIITFNSIISQQEYDLNTLVTNFVGLDLVKYDNKEVKSTSFLTLKTNNDTFSTGTPIEHYIFGGKLGFNPIPSTIKVIDLTYRSILPELTLDGDLSPFNINFDRAIVLYACYALLTKPGDNKNLGRANVKLSRFRENLSRLLKTYLFQDKGEIRYRGTYTPRSSITGVNRNRFRNI